MLKAVTITTAGLAARNTVISEGGEIKFTRAAIGTGKPGAGENTAGFTSLKSYKMDIEVKSSASASTTHEIIALIDNKDVEADFIMTELGIYASVNGGTEVLYAYTWSEHGIYIPAKQNKTVNEFVINTTISQSSNVTVVVDDRFVYATHEELALKADLTSPTFTGTPKAPTPNVSSNDTTIATTAFIKKLNYTQNKKPSTVVIGNSALHNALDVDILCTGTNVRSFINTAINSLSGYGGKILILEGTYSVGEYSGFISLEGENICIEGMGRATVINAIYSSSGVSGIISVYGNNNAVKNLYIIGNRKEGAGMVFLGTVGISLRGDNHMVSGVIAERSNSGIFLYEGKNQTVTGNICSMCRDGGITMNSSVSYSTITGNTCNENNDFAYLTYGSGINVNGEFNTISGNTCNGNTNIGIQVAGKGHSIVGNTANDNLNTGIRLESSSRDSAVIGNTVNLAGVDTIFLHANAAGNIIMGNIVKGKDVNYAGSANLIVNNQAII